MSIAYDIAKRLYGGDKTAKVSRPAVRLAVAGIVIGMVVMIVSIGVVLGFKHSIRDKVVGFGSHIVVTNYLTLQSPDQSQPIDANDSLMHMLKKTSGVKRVQRYSQKSGVLKTEDDFLGVMFKGIGEDYDTTFLKKAVVDGILPEFSLTKSKQQLLLSQNIADKLRLKVGDKVFAYFLSDDDVRARPFTVAGIYQTNMTKFDDVYCFTDLYTVSRLNGWEIEADDDTVGKTEGLKVADVSGVEILVNDFDSLDVVYDAIKKKVNEKFDDDRNMMYAASVKEMNPQIFSWLELLDMNVWIILILMICVAGVTIVSGLLIIILERTSTIGMLKAVGAGNAMIRHTFLWLAMFIVVKGMVIGNILGIGLCYLQMYTGIVKLDAHTYYVSEVPIEMNWWLIILLNIAVLIITMAVLVLPSYYVGTIKPAKTLRFA